MKVSQYDKLPYGTELLNEKGDTYFKMKDSGTFFVLFNPRDGQATYFGSVENLSVKKRPEHSPELVDLITQLTEALQLASDQLDYCGYGDSYEASCAMEDKIPEKIAAALKASEEYRKNK